MKIYLDDRFYIEDELYGFKLMDSDGAVRTNKKTGESWVEPEVIGYYGDLPQATTRYVRIAIANKIDKGSLLDYVNAYRAEVDRLLGVLPNIKKEN